MKKDLKRMLKLWKMNNPNNLEVHELFQLCRKYPDIDIAHNALTTP